MNPIGAFPVLANCDGHDTNIRNLEFSIALRQHKVYATCPPSNTTSSTQQCDQPKSKGGPIVHQKDNFKEKVMRHLRSKQTLKNKCDLSMRELAGESDTCLIWSTHGGKLSKYHILTESQLHRLTTSQNRNGIYFTSM